MFNVIVLVDEEEEEDADIVIAKKVEDCYPKNKFSDRYEQSTSSQSSCVNPFTPGIGVQVISPWHEISFISNRKVKATVRDINTRILCDHLIRHPILNITARATHPFHLRHPTHTLSLIFYCFLGNELSSPNISPCSSLWNTTCKRCTEYNSWQTISWISQSR